MHVDYAVTIPCDGARSSGHIFIFCHVAVVLNCTGHGKRARDAEVDEAGTGDGDEATGEGHLR